MFDSKFSYSISQPIKKSGPSEDGDLQSWLYKVRTTHKKSYFIKVCEYKYDVHFIKFYPVKLSQANDKYKRRLGTVWELNRLISTCFKLAFQILKKNEDAIFGFYGQWDKVDVERNDRLSQRYRIYTKAVISVLSKSEKYKFKYYPMEEINTFFVLPNHLSLEENGENLKQYFSEILSNEDIEALVIPTEILVE